MNQTRAALLGRAREIFWTFDVYCVSFLQLCFRFIHRSESGSIDDYIDLFCFDEPMHMVTIADI